jgi:hypothetical protein
MAQPPRTLPSDSAIRAIIQSVEQRDREALDVPRRQQDRRDPPGLRPWQQPNAGFCSKRPHGRKRGVRFVI